MSSIATLNEQLKKYDELGFHHHAIMAEHLQQVEQWQHQRIQKVHADLFNQPKHQLMAQFFFNRLYNLNSFETLANQLRKASDEKVKLERFVPEDVLQTTQMGFQLGLATLNLDQQLAFFCFANKLPVNDDSMLQALVLCQQFHLRQQQLSLLLELGESFHQYSQSRLLQAGLALAKGTAKRRGYLELFEYLSEGLSAMRKLSSVKNFFETFIESELAILEYVDGFHAFPPCMQSQTTE